jgi:hypothetical protein
MGTVRDMPGSINDLMKYATSLDPMQAQALVGKQVIGETKWDTLTLAAAAIPNQTQFFAAQTSELAIKNFDGNGYLVGQGKFFLAQTLGVKILPSGNGVTGQNIIDFVNQCAIRLQVDNKIMGTFPIHQLTGFGGIFAPSQIAPTVAVNPAGGVAASGLENGTPQNLPFRIPPMLLEGQKAFAAFLIAPTTNPINLAGTLAVKVLIGGLQFQAIQ